MAFRTFTYVRLGFELPLAMMTILWTDFVSDSAHTIIDLFGFRNDGGAPLGGLLTIG